MRPRVSLRPALDGDLPGIVSIYNHYVLRSAATFELRPVTPEERRPWFGAHRRSGPHRLWVAVDEDGALRAWASTSEFRPRAAYSTTVEASVYCRSDSCGAGIGTRLYGSLLRSIEGEDLERVVAGITLPNAPSVELHRRLGFQHVGTFSRVGRKFGRFWDVAWFERPARPGRLPPRSPRPPTSGRQPRNRSAREEPLSSHRV
jgi:phosphinothricin acetyltransferase